MNKIIKKIKIKKNDLIYIPYGKIYGLTKGITVFELQQADDTAYCLYDYNRVQPGGQKKQLHVLKALENVMVPDQYNSISNKQEGILIDNISFTLQVINCIDEAQLYFEQSKYIQITVISGIMFIEKNQFNCGDSIIIYDFTNFYKF